MLYPILSVLLLSIALTNTHGTTISPTPLRIRGSRISTTASHSIQYDYIQQKHILPKLTKHNNRYYSSSTQSSPNQLIGCAGLDMFIDITIGDITSNSTQTFEMIVDTGSTTLAVAGYTCTTCWNNGNINPLYSPTSTSTSVIDSSTGATAQITAKYGGGTGWTGNVVNDQITIGNITQNSQYTVPLNFGMITSSNSFFGSGDCYRTVSNKVDNQGIIGFAYQSLALAPTESWLAKTTQYKGLPHMYAMQLCQDTGSMVCIYAYRL